MKKKKKKDVGIDEALIFPGVVRTGYHRRVVSVRVPDPESVLIGSKAIAQGDMPTMLIGWVQNEVHVCYHYQSLS